MFAGKNRLERIRVYTSFKVKARQLPPVCSRCVDNPLSYGLVPPQRGSSRSSSGDVYNGVPVWPQIYFCIRTGDLKDAHTLLKTCLDEGINGVDEAAYVALGELVKLGQRSSDGGFRPHQISSVLSALSKCNALYRETLSGTSSNGYDVNRQNGNEQGIDFAQPDPYRLQVLSLLGLADLDALCEGAYLSETTVEDFLWTSLWFVHYTQLLSNAFMETTVADSDLPQVMPSFNQSKSYTPGLKAAPPTPATFASFNSPSRVASTGDRRTKFDLIDPLTQTPTGKDRNITTSNIRKMHSEHLPKVYR